MDVLLTLDELSAFSSRIDEITAVLDNPLDYDIRVNLIDELEEIISILNASRKKALIYELGLKLVK